MHTEAVGEAAHAEGNRTYAVTFAHAEGGSTRATGIASHSEGSQTLASGDASHAGGEGTIASAKAQTTIGRWNSPKETTLFEVGNGYSPEERQNAFEVYRDGHAEVQVQGTTDNSVIIKSELDARVTDIIRQFSSGKLTRAIVDVLPEIADANEDTIYMVKNASDINQNIYDEYMFINNNWEIIGSTQVDLSNFYTKQEIDAPKSSMLLKDSVTNIVYAISVANGKLVMEEQVIEEEND